MCLVLDQFLWGHSSRVCDISCSFSVCKMCVHKRCQKNVANNCGINTRDMAQILQEMGITTDKLTQKGRKKVSS